MAGSVLSSFLDGFSGGGFFRRISRPNAPTQLFADEGNADFPQKELVTALLAVQRSEDDAQNLDTWMPVFRTAEEAREIVQEIVGRFETELIAATSIQRRERVPAKSFAADME